MTVKISFDFRTAFVAALQTVGPHVLLIYTGPQPASPNSAPTGVLLARVPVDGGFTPANAEGCSLAAPNTPVPATASGTAGWARLEGSAAVVGGPVPWVDGSVGVAGADFILNSTNITAGGAVTVIGLVFSQPSN